MWNFLGTVSETLSWLYHDRQWATWELIGLAVVLLVAAVWIFKRLRRKPVRRSYGSHFLDGASVVGVNLASHSRNRPGGSNPRKPGTMHSADTNTKKENTGRKARGWKKAVEKIRQKPTEKKLEADLAELTAAYEQPREQTGENTQAAEPAAQPNSSSVSSDQQVHHESKDSEPPQAIPEQKVSEPAEGKETIESLEQRIAELTAANEKLQEKLNESRQATGPLEQELAGQTSVNEQLRKEVEAIKQAEERLERKVAELTAANEQLKQNVSTDSAKKDDDYDERHRVVEGVNEKLCGKCGQWKAEDQYHRHASSRDGLANKCRQCRADAARKRREKRNAAKD